MRVWALGLTFSLIFLGCATTNHSEKLHSTQEREMTVGIVQKEISVGQTQADVAESLGSPNIVTKGDGGNEVWVYDKIASEVSYSKSATSGGIGAGAGGVAGTTLLLGGVGVGSSSESGAAATTKKTLTVVIRFDASGRVESFSYHSSKF